MNFFKKTWGTLFSKTETNQTQNIQKQEGAQDDDIPLQVLEELFTLSCQFLKTSQKKLPNETLLEIYGLFKQANQGDCNTESPGMFDLKGKSKWNSWNSLKGMPKSHAMKEYIVKASEADPEISRKIQQHLSGNSEKNTQNEKSNSSGGNQVLGLKKIEAVDYSDQYSHPYFKLIEKDNQIPEVEHKLLLIKNDSPAVYPLHFAIDKERVDLVKVFMSLLSKEQISNMVDEEGTGILEYAQLIENEEILEIVKAKLAKE